MVTSRKTYKLTRHLNCDITIGYECETQNSIEKFEIINSSYPQPKITCRLSVKSRTRTVVESIVCF